MMSDYTIVLGGPHLAARPTAVPLRREALSAIETTGHVVFDCSVVVSLSDSYADEAFGVLASILGVDSFFDKVQFVNADEYVLASIAVAIDRRCPKPIAA